MKSKCGGVLFLFCMYFLTLTNVNMHYIKLFDNVSLLNNNDALGFTFNHFFQGSTCDEISDFSTGTDKRRLLSKHFPDRVFRYSF